MVFRKIIIITLCIFILSYKSYAKVLDKDFTYIDLNESIINPWAHIHVLRLNPSLYNFSIVSAKSINKKHAFIQELITEHKNKDFIIAINGGFFDKNHKALGLRINNYKTINPLKRISWWGIFYIDKHIPHIENIYNYNVAKNPQFAIQSGPRLIIDNHIPRLKPGLAQRSALCINKDNDLFIIATENLPISARNLAKILKSSPLNCTNAINLDGGGSTQLFVKSPDININTQGFSEVADAIVITSV